MEQALIAAVVEQRRHFLRHSCSRQRHIVYTHGYGAVASPSNSAKLDVTRNFYLRDVPVAFDGIQTKSGPPSSDTGLRREPW